MKLSHDDSSWKASGIKRRDFRHTHDGPEVPRHQGKKNRRKWCRGKVGREHQLVRVRASRWIDNDVCTECGKQVNWYFFFPGR